MISFLAYLEPKLWLKKQKLIKNSTLTNIYLWYVMLILYVAITRQQIELESCSSPLQMGSLVIYMEKLKLGMSRFCLCLQNGRMFVHICLHLDAMSSSFGSQPIELISWLKVF